MRILIDLQAAQTDLLPFRRSSTAVMLAKRLLQQAVGHECRFILDERNSGNVLALKEVLAPDSNGCEFRLFCVPPQDPSSGRTVSRAVYTDFIENNRPDLLIWLGHVDEDNHQILKPLDRYALSCATLSLRSEEDLPAILSWLNDASAGAAKTHGAAATDLMQCLADEFRRHPTSDEVIRNAAKAMAYNRRPEKRQLLLDVSVLAITDAKSGIQRVGRSIFNELLICPPVNHTVRAIRFSEGHYHYADAFAAKAGHALNTGSDEPVDFYQGDIYLSLDLNMHIVSEVEAIYRDMGNKGVELFFIVYDMLPIQHPEWWPAEISPMYMGWLDSLTRHASGLCCISAAVARDVSTWLEQHPPQRVRPGPSVHSFHLGADVQNSLPTMGLPESAEEILDSIQNSHSFLMVSTIEPRKGHRQTLDAFELLWNQGLDLKLVIAGRRGWLVDSLLQRIIEHPENGKRLLWLEGLSDEYLEKVYAASTCLIAASEGEGFGLPLIEAAQHRLPILARSLPVFKEVAGEHAHYFEGLSPQALAVAIQEWLALYQDNRHPQSAHFPWLNWKQSAQQLLDAIGLSTGRMLRNAPRQTET